MLLRNKHLSATPLSLSLSFITDLVNQSFGEEESVNVAFVGQTVLKLLPGLHKFL